MMDKLKGKVCCNKKNVFLLVSTIIIVLSIVIGFVYINPKMNRDVLFDKNNILKDRWVPLQEGQIIDNKYSFKSSDSKLSSVVLTVQNLNSQTEGKIRAIVENIDGEILNSLEEIVLPNTASQEIKVEITNKKSSEDIVIKLEEINNSEGVQTRVCDSEDTDVEAHLAYKIYSTMPDFVTPLTIIIFILVDLILIISFYFIFIKKESLEKIFIVTVLLCGICYMILFTPGNIPDDTTHIRNTLGFSSVLMSKGSREDIVIRESENFIGDTQPSIKTLNSYRKMINLYDNDNNYVNTGINLSVDFNVISYLPGILLVTLCRILSIDGILTIYIARFGNLIIYAVASYYAIKKIPIFKTTIFTIGLLPMVIHQCSSLSYDTIILSSAWLVIGYGFYFVYGKNKIKKVDMLIYIIASCVLVTQKSGIYFLLNLIPILINKTRISDTKERILTKITLICPWIITMVGLPLLTNNNLAARSVSKANVVTWANQEGYSFTYFISHIKETVMLFVRTVVKKFDHYVFTTLGQYLGSLNLILSRNIFIIWLVALFTSGFKNKNDTADISILHKIIYLLTFFAVCGASMLAMAFAFTPVGWPTIEGVQGRYFLPVIVFLVIFIRNKKIIIKNNLNRYFIMFIIILQTITVINILGALIIV